jgi:PAS domain S-box-containing protein
MRRPVIAPQHDVKSQNGEERYRSLFEDSPISLWEEDFSDIKTYIENVRASGVEDFRTYFEDHPEEVVNCVGRTKILDVNKATLKLYKARSKEELLGDLRQIAGEGVYETHKESLLAIIEGKTTFECETVNYTLVGDRMDVAMRWSVIPGYEEMFSKVLVSIIDISERVQAEQALRQYAERLRVLHGIDRAILAAQSPKAIAQAALAHIRELVPCTQASAVTFDWEAGEATVLAAHVDGQTTIGTGAHVPLEVFGDIEALRQGTVHTVEDISTLTQLSATAQALQANGIHFYINVPLISQGELIGSLNWGWDNPDAFTPQHMEVAREVADSLAIAIQNAQLFQQVHAGRERLRALSYQLLEVQETERRQIARELHDEVGQVLTGLKLLLEMSRRSPVDITKASLNEALMLVDELMERVDELALNLRPGMLDDLGLLPTLLWHFERYTKQTNIQVTLEHGGLEGQRFPPEVETAAYRIVQEGLTNVARHAGVSQVTVRLLASQDTLSLQVKDQGSGFDPGAALASGISSGLSGMRERARLLGGQLTIESAPGAGVRLTAELPLSDWFQRRGEHDSDRAGG